MTLPANDAVAVLVGMHSIINNGDTLYMDTERRQEDEEAEHYLDPITLDFPTQMRMRMHHPFRECIHVAGYKQVELGIISTQERLV
jgi:hypothetical protein